jgi:hypothetical protein
MQILKGEYQMIKSNLIFISALLILAISCGRNPTNNTTDHPLLIKTNAIDTNFTEDSLWVKTDTLVWIYDTSGFSTAYLIISGNTNANSIGIETHGDGLISIFPLELNIDNYFNDTVGIGFSHISGIFIGYNTKIYLYSNDNDTAIINVSNPN